jgi:hypothetical protein
MGLLEWCENTLFLDWQEESAVKVSVFSWKTETKQTLLLGKHTRVGSRRAGVFTSSLRYWKVQTASEESGQ